MVKNLLHFYIKNVTSSLCHQLLQSCKSGEIIASSLEDIAFTDF